MKTQNETPAAHWGRVKPLEIDVLLKANAELVEALRCIIAARDEAALVDDPALTLLDRAIDAAREAMAKGEVQP